MRKNNYKYWKYIYLNVIYYIYIYKYGQNKNIIIIIRIFKKFNLRLNTIKFIMEFFLIVPLANSINFSSASLSPGFLSGWYFLISKNFKNNYET